MKHFVSVVLFLSASGAAFADEAPARLACKDFHAEMTSKLAASPVSLQVNALLIEAARKGCADDIDALLAAGASRLARDREGHNALAAAARMGRLPIIEQLLKSANAAEAGEIEQADVNGSTPLLVASLANHTPAARRLIEAGANVNAVNTQGETALIGAAYTRNAELADSLLARGAKPDVIDHTGKGPMIYAAAQGSDHIVGALLGAGIDANALYRGNLTALMWAAGHADTAPASSALATVKLLIAHGAKVDLVDDRGRSALMIAAGLGHLWVVRALLDAGADPALRDKRGQSAVELTVSDDVKALLAAR